MEGMRIASLVHPEYRAHIPAGMDILRIGGDATVSMLCIRSDGSPIHVESSGSTLTYQGALHFLAVIRDVTSQVDAEEEIRRREQQYRDIFEAAHDAFLLFDQSGVLVEANPAACRMYGYSHDEILGLRSDNLIDPRSRSAVPTIPDDAAGGTVHARLMARRKDGTTFIVE